MKPLFVLFAVLTITVASAQTPTPVVVQTTPNSTNAAPPQIPSTGGAAPAVSVLTTLQELKTANDEFLKQQAATLQQLDDLQKAVEQLKIYSKRG